ncbi:MAG TPA: recombination mediator RecR [Candidatus Babeliales bacterium]|nr:recombination mediator RecR [Candidatus Babeliales bacterium]
MFNELPDPLKSLIKSLQQVPYLASKNMYRVTTYFLDMDQEKMEQFCRVLLQAQKNVVHCSICFFWQDKDKNCFFCSSTNRDQSIVCVVETWQELMAIEKTGGYNGVYHILGGVICPLEGIGPDNLTINQLLGRVDSDVKEIIFALNQTPEGEATAAYIASKLQASSVLITCLARGIPVGSSLEYIDRLTVYKALSERRPF